MEPKVRSIVIPSGINMSRANWFPVNTFKTNSSSMSTFGQKCDETSPSMSGTLNKWKNASLNDSSGYITDSRDIEDPSPESTPEKDVPRRILPPKSICKGRNKEILNVSLSSEDSAMSSDERSTSCDSVEIEEASSTGESGDIPKHVLPPKSICKGRPASSYSVHRENHNRASNTSLTNGNHHLSFEQLQQRRENCEENADHTSEYNREHYHQNGYRPKPREQERENYYHRMSSPNVEETRKEKDNCYVKDSDQMSTASSSSGSSSKNKSRVNYRADFFTKILKCKANETKKICSDTPTVHARDGLQASGNRNENGCLPENFHFDRDNPSRATQENNISEKSSQEISEHQHQCRCRIDCNGWSTCPTWRDKNVCFGQSEPSNLRLLRQPPDDEEETIEIERKKVKNIWFHGPMIPKPIRTSAEASFDEAIRKKLCELNCTDATVNQAHFWPAILRRMNVCLVSGKKTGKTMTYLPALCTFLLRRKEHYSDLSEYDGPIALILCPSTDKFKKIYSTIKLLMEDAEDQPNVHVATDSSSLADLDKCDILISTPTLFVEGLIQKQLSVKRLCHLVLEGADVILKLNCKIMQDLFPVLDEIQERRPQYQKIQIISVSDSWSLNLENLCKYLHSSPLISVRNFLQAALYYRLNTTKKVLKTEFKAYYLQDLLISMYNKRKAIVFCGAGEMQDLNERLHLKGIETIRVTDEMTDEDIMENQDIWNHLKAGHCKVLLCTDTSFARLNKVARTSRLIHYTLPKTWDAFAARFRCFVENGKCCPNEREIAESFVIVERESEITERLFNVIAGYIAATFVLPNF